MIFHCRFLKMINAIQFQIQHEILTSNVFTFQRILNSHAALKQ